MDQFSAFLGGIGAVAFLLWIYQYITKNNDFFKKKGLAHLKPMFFFGNTAPMVFKQMELIDYVVDLYSKFPNEKYVESVLWMSSVL